MTPPAIPLKEFDEEMATTRKLLARVPTDKGQWKPHVKSFPLGHLTQLIAGMPGWITNVLTQPHLDLAGGPGYSFEKTEDLLVVFDKHVTAARAALQSVTGDRLNESWSLKNGPMLIMTLPRGEVARQNLNHLIHHRGQLSVYLRLVEVPLPMIYGPTADERWGG
jgi:uncharacterized damage-inducible protein DinB